MAFTTDPTILKHQLESRKNILLVYLLIGTALLVIGFAVDDETAPATFLYIGAVLIGYIFFIQVGGFAKNPSDSGLNSLKTIMYLFIGVFVVALIVDVTWWEALYYTTFLGAVLAISGFFIMNQILTDGKLLLGGGQGTRTPTRTAGIPSQKAKRPNFCPNCSESLENLKNSNFCPNCGEEV